MQRCALVEKADSKSAEGNLVGVRPPLPAPIKSKIYQINASSDAFFCAQTVPKVQDLLLSSIRVKYILGVLLVRGCIGTLGQVGEAIAGMGGRVASMR